MDKLKYFSPVLLFTEDTDPTIVHGNSTVDLGDLPEDSSSKKASFGEYDD